MAKTFPSSTCSSMNLLRVSSFNERLLVSLGRRDTAAKALVRLPRDRRIVPVALRSTFIPDTELAIDPNNNMLYNSGSYSLCI